MANKRKFKNEIGRIPRNSSGTVKFPPQKWDKDTNSDHLDKYHYYKAERANPRNTYDKVMDNIKRIYGIGHTKVLEVVKTLDREMQTFDL